MSLKWCLTKSREHHQDLAISNQFPSTEHHQRPRKEGVCPFTILPGHLYSAGCRDFGRDLRICCEAKIDLKRCWLATVCCGPIDCSAPHKLEGRFPLPSSFPNASPPAYQIAVRNSIWRRWPGFPEPLDEIDLQLLLCAGNGPSTGPVARPSSHGSSHSIDDDDRIPRPSRIGTWSPRVLSTAMPHLEPQSFPGACRT